MQKYVIIVAGGDGTRMKSTVPKQFLILYNRPVLMHTIQVFEDTFPYIKIIVVLPKKLISEWDELVKEYNFPIIHTVTEGGPTRFHSVKNGLKQIHEKGFVAIHDGVRPLVSKDTIIRSFECAEITGSSVPVIKLVDSIREVNHGDNKPVDRLSFRLIQTPQIFNIEGIKNAYEQSYSEEFTDDATVFESVGGKIHLVDGNPENIKITTEIDLIIAEAVIQNKMSPDQGISFGMTL